MICTVKDVYGFIDSIAPFDTQCEWDNSGIIIGSDENQVKKIGVVLDITIDAVEYARKNNIDLIVSHHPVIFKPVNTIGNGDPVYHLIKNGISAICAHTSLDAAKGGVNDVLADALGFENVSEFAQSGELAIMRIAQAEETDGESLANLVTDKLSTCVSLADSKNKIKKIALCGGSGGEYIDEVAAAGCDAFITGEAKYHHFLRALDLGVTMITAGHFETENPVVAVLAKKLSENFSCEIEIIPQNSPVKYYK